MTSTFFGEVLTAIELNNEFCGRTVKINDICTYYMLTSNSHWNVF